MNKTKRGYEAPTSELLVVRFEHNFLTSGSVSTEQGTIIDDVDWDS